MNFKYTILCFSLLFISPLSRVLAKSHPSSSRITERQITRNHKRASWKRRLILAVFSGNADGKWPHRSISGKSVKWFWCRHPPRFTQPITLFAESSEHELQARPAQTENLRVVPSIIPKLKTELRRTNGSSSLMTTGIRTNLLADKDGRGQGYNHPTEFPLATTFYCSSSLLIWLLHFTAPSLWIPRVKTIQRT